MRTNLNNLSWVLSGWTPYLWMLGKSIEEWRDKGLAGTPAQVVDQIGEYADLGIQRLIIQQFDPGDLSIIEEFAAKILPHFRAG